MVTDQLGTPRMVFDQTGGLSGVKRHDYLPFGEEIGGGVGVRTIQLGYGISVSNRFKFAKLQRDDETGLDYAKARYYSSIQGRFTSLDDIKYVLPTDPATWNLYSYVRNGPLTRNDPTGHNWYQYKGAWYWFEGSKPHTFVDADGNKTVVTKSYEYLLRFTKTGTNKEGAAVGYLELYKQNVQVARSDVFSGGAQRGFNIIPNGTYFILNRKEVLTANDVNPDYTLKPSYGIQRLPDEIRLRNGVMVDPTVEWGNIRARLNYPGESNPALDSAYKGNFLHGKDRIGDYTHSCVCERTEVILNILLGLDSSKVPSIPVWVKQEAASQH